MTVGGLGGNELYVGRQSHGTINMGAGTSLTVANALILGHETSPVTVSTGTVNNNGGTITTTSGNFTVGNGVSNVVSNLGTFTQTAGSTSVGSEFQVGNLFATGVANISGGSVTVNTWVAIGRDGGTGTVNVSGTGSLIKGAGSGTFDIGVFGNGATPGTGTLNETGGSVVNTVSNTNIGRDGNSVGIWNLIGGTATLANLVIGRDGGSNGTLNQSGGLLSVNGISAGGGIANLNLGPGTIVANQDNASFINGFSNSGGHSAINLTGAGPTINSNGHRIRITAGNVIGGLDANPSDGLAGTALTITGDATLFNDTDKVTLEIPVGTGNLSVHVLSGGFLDFEVSQTLDALVIESGGYTEISALNSPPGAPPLAEPAPAFDIGAGAALAASPVQGVPEPGSISLLLLSALGLLGRRNRDKKA